MCRGNSRDQIHHIISLAVSKLDRRCRGRMIKRDNLLTEEGGGCGAELCDRKNAWPSIHHSILSAKDDKEEFKGTDFFKINSVFWHDLGAFVPSDVTLSFT